MKTSAELQRIYDWLNHAVEHAMEEGSLDFVYGTEQDKLWFDTISDSLINLQSLIRLLIKVIETSETYVDEYLKQYNEPTYQLNEYQVKYYDTWGNEEDGFEVNDIHSGGRVFLKEKRVLHNGSRRACSCCGSRLDSLKNVFAAWEISDEELCRALDCDITKNTFDWIDENVCEITATTSGKPLGRLERVDNGSNGK